MRTHTHPHPHTWWVIYWQSGMNRVRGGKVAISHYRVGPFTERKPKKRGDQEFSCRQIILEFKVLN